MEYRIPENLITLKRIKEEKSGSYNKWHREKRRHGGQHRFVGVWFVGIRAWPEWIGQRPQQERNELAVEEPQRVCLPRSHQLNCLKSILGKLIFVGGFLNSLCSSSE